MTTKIELSPIGLYTLEFESSITGRWTPLRAWGHHTWNATFREYRRRVTAINDVGLPAYVLHRIVPVYEN